MLNLEGVVLRNGEIKMNRNDVDTFEKLFGQLLSIYEELTILSKKNPIDAVNKFKLGFVNKLLIASNEFLTKKYLPFEDFESFNEDDMPNNSDVVFILSQYLQCFEKLRSDNVINLVGRRWYWEVEGNEKDEDIDDDGMVHIRTIRPKNLKE